MRKIEVVDYKSEWQEIFDTERRQIAEALSGLNAEILHIGSTSVPGLAAKPLIDILIGVDDLSALESRNSKLEQLGYTVRGEHGIPGRRFFCKGSEDNRRFNVHAFLKDDPGFERHLAFRDYLRSHPEVAAVYAGVKKRVAADCDNSIDKYCDGKNDFVKAAEEEALRWYRADHIKGYAAKLHHVEIYVSDIKKTRGFWEWLLCHHLGYEIFQQWDQGISFIPTENQGACIAGPLPPAPPYIVFVQAEERFLNVQYHRCRPGLNHFAFYGRDRHHIDSLTDELRQRGCTILYEDRHPFAGGEDYYAVYFEDPERIKVEVVAP